MVLEIALGVFIGLAAADAVKDLSEFLASKYRAHQSHKRLQKFLEESDSEPTYKYESSWAPVKRKPVAKKTAKKKPVKKRK